MGRAEEINLPSIKHKMADHKGLGLMAETEFWTGGIEKLEAKIKWSSFYLDAYQAGANPNKTASIQVRGNLKSFNSQGLVSEVAYVCYITAMFKETPLGNFKQLDNAEFESNLTVYYVKLEVDGQSVIEIDPLANIYKTSGTDVLARYRLNVGS